MTEGNDRPSVSTDPRWDADKGGLPVHPSWRWAPRSDTCAGGEPGIAPPSTVTPPAREPSQQERLIAFVREALEMSDQGVPELQALGIRHGLLIEAADPSEPPAIAAWFLDVADIKRGRA